MKHSSKVERTKILPLRWIANLSSRIATEHLLKAVYLDEDKNWGIKYKYHGKMWKIFNKPYELWGTYYSLDIHSMIKELKNDPEYQEIMDSLGSDYDDNGVPYWDKWKEGGND